MKKFFLLTVFTAVVISGLNTTIKASHTVVEVGSENFEQFAKAEKPFIIDVWADWCPPCKMMKPIFEEVAKNNSDYIFGTLDFQKEAELGKQLQVRSLPTFIVIKGGKEYGRIIGAVTPSAKDLLEKINECLENKTPMEIGSDIALSPQEFLMKLSMLMQKPTEEEQIKELKELFKVGLTADMVLAEVPATAYRPAVKITVASWILGMNKALFPVLLDHGVDVDQVSAEIDLKINEFNEGLAKMNEFKNMLKAHTS